MEEIGLREAVDIYVGQLQKNCDSIDTLHVSITALNEELAMLAKKVQEGSRIIKSGSEKIKRAVEAYNARKRLAAG